MLSHEIFPFFLFLFQSNLDDWSAMFEEIKTFAITMVTVIILLVVFVKVIKLIRWIRKRERGVR